MNTTTITTERTHLKCKDIVRNACKSRLSDILRLYKAYCKDPEKEVEDIGRLDEYGLSWEDYHIRTNRSAAHEL